MGVAYFCEFAIFARPPVGCGFLVTICSRGRGVALKSTTPPQKKMKEEKHAIFPMATGGLSSLPRPSRLLSYLYLDPILISCSGVSVECYLSPWLFCWCSGNFEARTDSCLEEKHLLKSLSLRNPSDQVARNGMNGLGSDLTFENQAFNQGMLAPDLSG